MQINNSHVDLEEIEKLTIGHYENNAESFRVGTKDHDVSQNIAAFLGALPKDKKLDILDFGCGPGRDVNVFKEMGTGLLGWMEQRILQNDSAIKQCPILHQKFLHLELEDSSFDGIFANASLFHVPSLNFLGY
ncbi:MAG: hypothetical protein Ct9H300mP28_23190 [Pseudomonadota bacterium]|nr:MAG: hypothetical protein Ct9H300mP28_23190 [Pseudomonadota bacterium]